LVLRGALYLVAALAGGLPVCFLDGTDRIN
jgi:hypothetical protein